MKRHGYLYGKASKQLVPLIILAVFTLVLVSCSSTATTTPPPASTTSPMTTSAAPAASTALPSTTLPGVSASPVSEDMSKYGGTLRWIQGTGPGAPIGIPWEASGASAFNMQHSLEFMVQEQVDGTLTPLLAASWDVVTDANNPAITFHLQKGVKFHDGTDFNAQAAKWNLEKEMDKSSTNYGATTNWKSIEALDDYTLRVNLKTWQNTQLVTFANATASMISPTAFESRGAEALRWNMVGTGPFIETKYEADVALTFNKNPSYWQHGLPYVDKLQIIYATDLLTCSALLKSGGADILNCQGSATLANDVKAAGFKIVTQPAGTGGLANLTPDSANPASPWADIRVRMAAEYAIDKEALAKTFGMGYSEPAYQLCAPVSVAYDPELTGRKYDPEKAKQLLAEAGYPTGFKTTIIAAPFGLNRDQLVAIQAYLADVGIRCELQFPAAAQAMQYITGILPTNSLLMNPYMLYANPNRVFQNYYNDPVTSNKSVKRPDGFVGLLAATLSTPEVDPALARQCSDALYNDCSFIPIAWSIAPFAMAGNVQDTGIGTRGSLTYWNPDKVYFGE